MSKACHALLVAWHKRLKVFYKTLQPRHVHYPPSLLPPVSKVLETPKVDKSIQMKKLQTKIKNQIIFTKEIPQKTLKQLNKQAIIESSQKSTRIFSQVITIPKISVNRILKKISIYFHKR